MEWLIYCIAIVLAYFFVKIVAAAFRKSRCCKAKVRYQFGYSYKHDGNVCVKCGMLQD